MEYTLENECLRVALSGAGGRMLSVRRAGDGTEYLWQGDPAYWPERSFHIFPYVGRLTDKTYLLRGRRYTMDIHGFIAQTVLAAERPGARQITLRTGSTPKTIEAYPYRFSYSQHYCLRGNELEVAYEVSNEDETTMYFGLGAHPAFNVPLQNGLGFSDYTLEFGGACTPMRVGMTDECFVGGGLKPYPLEGGRRIRLRYEMFDHDAVILGGTSKTVTLQSERGSRAVSVFFGDFPYLMLWSMPGVCAPYLCIEPVTSLSARQGVVEDLARQESLVALQPQKKYRAVVRYRFL